MALRSIALLLTLVAMVSGCSHADNQSTSPESSAGLSYPPGVVPPADWVEQKHSGIYASDDPKQCCFLARQANFVLDNPAGSERVVFTFFLPSVKPLEKNAEHVSLRLNGMPIGTPAEVAEGEQNIIFTIPPSMRNTTHLKASLTMSVSWVPAKVGFNADTRELSVMLLKVGYI